VDWKEEIRNRNEVRRRLSRLAWLLDSSIPIPGTRLSIGIDALIGLVPFIGDVAGVLLSSTILIEAARLGAGRSVLARMALNVAVEGLAGLVPVAGDVFDAAWKANQRNVRLLNQWLDQPQRAERSSVLLVAGLVAGLVALVVILLLLAFLALRWLMDCC
jgi:Domain of unknown function (DUF4112)